MIRFVFIVILLMLLSSCGPAMRQECRSSDPLVKGACQGNKSDQYQLGKRYYSNEDGKNAVYWLEQSSSFTSGMASIYIPPIGNGYGSVMNTRIGPDQHGNRSAMLLLAKIYSEGLVGVEKNEKKAKSYRDSATAKYTKTLSGFSIDSWVSKTNNAANEKNKEERIKARKDRIAKREADRLKKKAKLCKKVDNLIYLQGFAGPVSIVNVPPAADLSSHHNAPFTMSVLGDRSKKTVKQDERRVYSMASMELSEKSLEPWACLSDQGRLQDKKITVQVITSSFEKLVDEHSTLRKSTRVNKQGDKTLYSYEGYRSPFGSNRRSNSIDFYYSLVNRLDSSFIRCGTSCTLSFMLNDKLKVRIYGLKAQKGEYSAFRKRLVEYLSNRIKAGPTLPLAHAEEGMWYLLGRSGHLNSFYIPQRYMGYRKIKSYRNAVFNGKKYKQAMRLSLAMNRLDFSPCLVSSGAYRSLEYKKACSTIELRNMTQSSYHYNAMRYMSAIMNYGNKAVTNKVERLGTHKRDKKRRMEYYSKVMKSMPVRYGLKVFELNGFKIFGKSDVFIEGEDPELLKSFIVCSRDFETQCHASFFDPVGYNVLMRFPKAELANWKMIKQGVLNRLKEFSSSKEE